MDVPVDRDMEGRPLANPGVLHVDWQGKMAFDGRVTHFERQVVASGESQQLHTECLDVTFREPLVLGDAASRPPPQVAQIVCRGGMLLENRSIQGGQQVSFDRLLAADMRLEMESGAIAAGGPGWAVSVRRGSAADPLQSPHGSPAGQGAAPAGRGKPLSRWPALPPRGPPPIPGN